MHISEIKINTITYNNTLITFDNTGYIYQDEYTMSSGTLIWYSVFDLYSCFGDKNGPIYSSNLRLPVPFTPIPRNTQNGVMHVIENALTEQKTER